MPPTPDIRRCRGVRLPQPSRLCCQHRHSRALGTGEDACPTGDGVDENGDPAFALRWLRRAGATGVRPCRRDLASGVRGLVWFMC